MICYIMPSVDTIPFKITINTKKELERWKKKISEVLGVDIDSITYKQAEIAMRISSTRGNVPITTLREILLGKIK